MDRGFRMLGPMTSHQNRVSLRIGSVRTPSLLYGLPDVRTHGSLLDGSSSRAGALPLSGWRRAASGQGLSLSYPLSACAEPALLVRSTQLLWLLKCS